MPNILTFILRNSLGDSTANGLTSKVNQVDLHYGDTVDLADLNNIPDDELVLVERQLFGREAWYAVPAGIYKSNKHSMFGGNFIHTSDSRFPGRAPIPVHDRIEA
ncbi:hypothetical protein OAC86_01065 [bacterium]|jgi:hypothetical protein|nr:hypothetical protein [bacterium]MDB9900114.1 hypothetical protein [bacterium]